LRKINLGQKKKENRKIFFSAKPAGFELAHSKKTQHWTSMRDTPRARAPPQSHTHRSAVRPAQTTFHSDDVITRGVGLFDTKRYTVAPTTTNEKWQNFLETKLTVLYICFFVRVLVCFTLYAFTLVWLFFSGYFCKNCKILAGP